MIKENIKKIQEQLPEDVILLVVSKTRSIEEVEEAYECGIRDFGENKVQELLFKEEILKKDIRWHLIGKLQTNKVKYIVGKVNLIHSLDSIKLLEKLEVEFSKKNMVANTLIQINIGKEESKSGIFEENLLELIYTVERCRYVKVNGIMVIIPKGDEDSNRTYFKKTKEIWDDLSKEDFNNVEMNILSMGMSNDFDIAIEEGSTLIRIGEGIFGKRN